MLLVAADNAALQIEPPKDDPPQRSLIALQRRQAYRFYCGRAWRGPRRVQIALDDRSIDFPLQLILKQARAVKSRIGLERTQGDNFAAVR